MQNNIDGFQKRTENNRLKFNRLNPDTFYLQKKKRLNAQEQNGVILGLAITYINDLEIEISYKLNMSQQYDEI